MQTMYVYALLPIDSLRERSSTSSSLLLTSLIAWLLLNPFPAPNLPPHPRPSPPPPHRPPPPHASRHHRRRQTRPPPLLRRKIRHSPLPNPLRRRRRQRSRDAERGGGRWGMGNRVSGEEAGAGDGAAEVEYGESGGFDVFIWVWRGGGGEREGRGWRLGMCNGMG